MAEQLALAFGDSDDIVYTRTTADQTETLTEATYNEAMQRYTAADIVHFGYGAAD